MSAAGAIRTVLLRTVFLLIGAALFLAFGLLGLSLAAIGRTTANPVVGFAGALLVVALLVATSFFPGVRDVEVAAARILLVPDGELVDAPAEPRRHRWRTTWFVLAHVVLGGLVGTALVVGVPLAASELPWYAASAAVVAILALVVLLGPLVARLAVVCLGPTDTDRLAVAEQRIAREHGQRLLARDLHDGIGHALSVISLQAVAGRRVVDRDPAHAAESLEIIAATAREALDELDHALGMLRDEPAARTPEQRLTDVPALVASYRSAGADVRAELEEPAGVAPLVSREAYRIVQEALTNAYRHGDGSPISLATRVGPELVVEVRNGTGPRRGTDRRTRTGHGLAGLRERVALLGGDLEVGAADTATWVLVVRIPLAREGV